MLGQAHSVATFGYCLFVGLGLQFCLQQLKSCSTEADLATEQYSIFSLLTVTLVVASAGYCVYCVCVNVFILLYCEATSYRFYCLWLNVGRGYRSIHFRIHGATSVSTHIINKHPFHRQQYMPMS